MFKTVLLSTIISATAFNSPYTETITYTGDNGVSYEFTDVNNELYVIEKSACEIDKNYCLDESSLYVGKQFEASFYDSEKFEMESITAIEKDGENSASLLQKFVPFFFHIFF